MSCHAAAHPQTQHPLPDLALMSARTRSSQCSAVQYLADAVSAAWRCVELRVGDGCGGCIGRGSFRFVARWVGAGHGEGGVGEGLCRRWVFMLCFLDGVQRGVSFVWAFGVLEERCWLRDTDCFTLAWMGRFEVSN